MKLSNFAGKKSKGFNFCLKIFIKKSPSELGDLNLLEIKSNFAWKKSIRPRLGLGLGLALWTYQILHEINLILWTCQISLEKIFEAIILVNLSNFAWKQI